MKFKLSLFILLFVAFAINAQDSNELARQYLEKRGELAFTLTANNIREVQQLTNIISFDHGQNPNKPLTIRAIANKKEFQNFLKFNLPFSVIKSENEPKEAVMFDPKIHKKGVSGKNAAYSLSFPLTAYPNYSQYANQMNDFVAAHSSIAQKVVIGQSVNGKDLILIKLSDNVSARETEPRILLTSSIHGDEIAGYPMMLSLIDFLINAYENTGDPRHAEIKNIIDNSEIWINPMANPDGTFFGSATYTSVAGARRANANAIDLNRNYPDPRLGANPDGNSYQPETLAFMDMANNYHFVLASNFHGGVEVVNYPWDTFTVAQGLHTDNDWYRQISIEYATNAQNDSPAGYFDYVAHTGATPGVTHGASWYQIAGGRQDYMNYAKQSREVTIELSDIKNIAAGEIQNHWNYNRDALIDFIKQGINGFQGVVHDVNTNLPILAKVTVIGRDDQTNSRNSWVETELLTGDEKGDYYRPIKAGTYNILYEADCYQPFTLTNQIITDGAKVSLPVVNLVPSSASAPINLTATGTVTTSSTVGWDGTGSSFYDVRYRVVGALTWIDILDLTTTSNTLTGLTAATNYEVQVRSKCSVSDVSAYSSSKTFTTTAVNYCASSGYANEDYGITNVSFNTINNNSSTYNSGYSDFTSISTVVTKGLSYNLSASIYAGTNNWFYTYAWFDWNQDGLFEVSERFYLGSRKNNGLTGPATITIPASALLGNTRMRVTTIYNATPGSCDNSFYGEAEDYTINIIGVPEINIQGNGTTITDGDTSPSTTDHTDFGAIVTGNTLARTFTIQNTGNGTLNLTGTSPYIVISGANAAEFTVTAIPNASIAPSGSTTFGITFNPSATGLRTATLTIANNDSNENPYNFSIQGTGIIALTNGPGGVTSNLQLWLRSDLLNGTINIPDNTAVNTWNTQALGNDAVRPTNTGAPIYRNNAASNINFNSVVDFTNDYTSVPLVYTDDDNTRQYLKGTSGFYTQDMFVVMIPDVPITSAVASNDIFCGDRASGTQEPDATGIGYGAYSARFSNEVLTYAIGTTSGTPPTATGYGVANVSTTASYSTPGIINARNNAGITGQELYFNANNQVNTTNEPASFVNVSNSQYWIGRSEGWTGSLDGRVAEIITYSSSATAIQRSNVQSYLAIKYGITLGINGISINYTNSDGNVIWDATANAGYNYDIAGMGRDDASLLNQKQSKSVNNASDGSGPIQGILTMGLADIYATNSENITTNAANTFNDKEFLVWGDNGVNLNLAATVISVNMSAGISPTLVTDVTFTGMQRVWKVVETGGDVPTAKVSIPKSAVRNISPPGSFLMFISDTDIFDPTADYRVMTESGGNLYAEYDFDATKYITFGYAPEIVVERSIYFDGFVDYVDMEDALDLNPTEFTISSWIKRGAGSSNKSILSKRDVTYTEGYDFKITAANKFEMSWGNAGAQKITSNTTIPQDKWHHVAIIYGGGSANLYIDGVLDNTTPLTAPAATAQSFFIAAAGKNAPEAFFQGNIDEVRVWDVALTEDQLRYIMNQELIDKNDIALPLIKGNVIPTAITKNEISAIPWANLVGYYPLSVYTYTNTNDMSGNGHQGALRNLDTVDRQTAPLPYVSDNDGAWNTPATWLNYEVQDLPNSASIVDGLTPIDWNIVEVSNVITSGVKDITVLGLISTAGKLTIDGNNALGTGQALRVTHYLELDGSIDLEGESQLVQDQGSILDADSGGDLERDQQGTANSFNYNYWSSSVGPTSGSKVLRGTGTASINAPFTINGIINDGRDATPPSIVYGTSPYAADATPGAQLIISNYWLYQFYGEGNDYNSWFPRINENASLAPGVGYTMKGSSGKVPIADQQNYVFRGKPYNGDFTVELSKDHISPAGNVDRLIGNPYPSALDATKFILDNLSVADGGTNTKNIFNGALYFWDHFGQINTHILREYVGGYATRNLTAGAPAISNDSRINNNLAEGTKIPQQYIPVHQGFFVGTKLGGFLNNNSVPIPSVIGGDIVFKNSQRVFKKETTSNSVFMKSVKTKVENNQKIEENANARPILRLMYDSPTGYHRQIVMGMVENTSNHFDLGYDAPIADINKEDMYWNFDGAKFVIQGVPNFNDNQEFSLGLIVSKTGLARIKIEELENVDENISVHIKDKLMGETHNISRKPFEIDLAPGTYLDRFALTFKTQKLMDEDVVTEVLIPAAAQSIIEGIHVYMNNAIGELQIKNNSTEEIVSVALINAVGQTLKTWNSNFNVRTISLPIGTATGVYLVQINTKTGSTVKKISVE